MEYKIELSILATNALWHCINNTDTKGYGVKHHAKVSKALKRDAMEDMGKENWSIKGGTLCLDEDRYEYAKDIIKQKTDGGIPGVLAEGYADLNEAMDNAVKEDKSE